MNFFEKGNRVIVSFHQDELNGADAGTLDKLAGLLERLKPEQKVQLTVSDFTEPNLKAFAVLEMLCGNLDPANSLGLKIDKETEQQMKRLQLRAANFVA